MKQKEIKELMNLPLTDFGNALRLQTLFGKRWVYLPRYRYWMYRDSHSWKGKPTLNVVYAASDAFRKLAQAIYLLPVPKEEREQDRRVRIISWLNRSQRPTCAKKAVIMYRDMQLAEEAVMEEVLRG